MIHNLHEYLKDESQSKLVILSDISYTLQCGREEMSYRIGFVTSSKNLLKKQLQSFLVGESKINGCYQG